MITKSEETTVTTVEYDWAGRVIKETRITTRTIDEPDKTYTPED